MQLPWVRESDGDAMRSASILWKRGARSRIVRNCCTNWRRNWLACPIWPKRATRNGFAPCAPALATGAWLPETKRGLAIDRQAVTELERFDGKFVVHSNDDTLTAEDMAMGYKQQQRVEEVWRTMKSGLKMCPVFHWAPHRIHADIAITVLSLLLERTIEHACLDT